MSNVAKIDFRVRPPFKSYESFFANPAGFEAFTKSFLGVEVEGSQKTKSVDDLLAELDSVNTVKAVIPGRGLIGVNNDDLFEFAEKYGEDRFIIFPFLDHFKVKESLAAIDKYIINGKGKGASMEPTIPTLESPKTDFDDERIFPIYAKLEENNIPLLITFSTIVVPEVNAKYVIQIQNIAKKFPKLKLVIAHAGWPFTREMVAVAFSHKNVYLIPDAYGLKGPGAQDFITAAKSNLKNQIVFGSSYPIVPVVDTTRFVEDEWGLDDETKQKVFYDNAASILGL